jgi:hypothetical protein
MLTKNLQPILAGVMGMIIGGVSTSIVFGTFAPHEHFDRHPIADPTSGEYHVHADFHIVIKDALVDLSTDNYMTTAGQELHPDAHLHDGEGDVKHIHAEGITFSEFLQSLGITVTNECITYDSETFCTDDTYILSLYVENELYAGEIKDYIPVDDERILLYYGTRDNQNLPAYLEAVPDDSCFYSGTCPERGVAPPESCGLTCEL